jgi:hypothetical protein
LLGTDSSRPESHLAGVAYGPFMSANSCSIPGEDSVPLGSAASLGSKGTKIVRLNVGGTKFVTTEATLLSCGSSFFSSLLSGFPSLKDEEGAYFIDRDGGCFAPILSFLRTGQLIVPPHVPREVWQYSAYCTTKGIDHSLCSSCRLSSARPISSRSTYQSKNPSKLYHFSAPVP